MTAIVWFRQDLRLADNPALYHACRAAGQVIPLFIHDPTPTTVSQLGAASSVWLHHSLQALDADLQAVGNRLVLRQGEALPVLQALIAATGTTRVYWNRVYDPIVDAGMRELWHTGWMHNRVRMIVVSFLTKNLLIPWQAGENWFRDTLVDADLASNVFGWQWTAGCGADAAPYFRIFNPMLQSQKFDAAGDYIRRWAPELPCSSPIVDLKASRERALERFKRIAGSG
jgi:deoxyribodipyrimidine photolyase